MLPPVEQIVTQPAELPDVCAYLAAARRFGFDTEFVGEDTYQPRLCLIQVATAERLMLIDPFTVGPLDAFWKLLVDPANEVIVHAGREEVRVCQAWTGQTPGNLFDLQIAAGLVGLAYPLSHAALVSQLLGINLSKTETLTEWRDRPLTARQIRYAFDDVRYLLPLAGELSQRLTRLGRTTWAREEFARLAVRVTDGEPAVEKWRKLRGLGSLNRRQLAIVRELSRWREELAHQTNRPPRTLCRDDLLIEIARRNPVTVHDLHVIRGLNRRNAEAILAAVDRARRLSPEDCPTIQERTIEIPQVTLLGNLLTAVLGHLCSEMQLASNLVGSASDLRQLARALVTGEPIEDQALLNNGWRRDHIRCVLDAVLQGQLALRVVRPQADAPLELRPTGQEGGDVS